MIAPRARAAAHLGRDVADRPHAATHPSSAGVRSRMDSRHSPRPRVTFTVLGISELPTPFPLGAACQARHDSGHACMRRNTRSLAALSLCAWPPPCLGVDQLALHVLGGGNGAGPFEGLDLPGRVELAQLG